MAWVFLLVEVRQQLGVDEPAGSAGIFYYGRKFSAVMVMWSIELVTW